MKWLALAALVACGGSKGPQPDGTGGPAITVTVALWGATPDSIEHSVVTPLEQKLASEPNVETVRSVSRPNQGQVVVWFKSGTDPGDAARRANESLKSIRRVLPPEAGFPVISIGDPDAPPDLAYVATSKMLSIGEASDLLERQVAPAISTRAGVRRVAVTGARPPELQIRIDAERVRATGITHDEVIRALADTDRFTLEAAENIQVAQLSHVPVLVKDVASISLTTAPAVSDEPLGLGIWLQAPEHRADVEQALHEILVDAPRSLEIAVAPPRPPAPTLAIELVGDDRIELDAIADSLTSDLADIATLTREPAPPREAQRILVIDPAAQATLNVSAESVRAVVGAYAREPLRPRVIGTHPRVVVDLGSSPLDAILLRATDGAAIPLSMLATLETKPATPIVHVNLWRAVVLTVTLKAGGTVGDVQALLDKHPRVAHDAKARAPRARLVTRKRPQ